MSLVLPQLPWPSARSKAEAGRFRLFGGSFLPCVPMGWDATGWHAVGWCAYAFAFLESRPFSLYLFLSLSLSASLSRSYTHVHTCLHYINTHTALLPNMLHKGLFSQLLHRGHTFSGLAVVCLVGKPLTCGRNDLAVKVHLANPVAPQF